MIIRLNTPLDDSLKIPARTILHDNVNSGAALVHDAIMVLDDVRMLQLAQDIDLRYDLLLLFLIHLAIIELLPYKYLAITDPLNFTHKPEASCQHKA